MDIDNLTAEDIITIITSQHWDMVACKCWICEAGRRIGCGATEEGLRIGSKKGFAHIQVLDGKQGRKNRGENNDR
jgi:uncharacterized protein (DUF2345 family)